MGAVWRARDLRTGDWVAAKVLARHDAGAAAALRPRAVGAGPAPARARPDRLGRRGRRRRDRHGPGARRLAARPARRPRRPARALRPGAPRPAAPGPRGDPRRRGRPPRPQAGQPAPRRHRPRAARGCGSPTSASPRPRRAATGERSPGRSAPTATSRPSGSPGRRPTRARTCTPPGGSPPSCSPARRAGDGAPTGPLGPLVHALTEPDPCRRTPTAAAALAHLRALGVPGRRPGARRSRSCPTASAPAVGGRF